MYPKTARGIKIAKSTASRMLDEPVFLPVANFDTFEPLGSRSSSVNTIGKLLAPIDPSEWVLGLPLAISF
jgi:hypothetical protein